MMKVVPTRVGDAYQAEIPAMLTQEERASRVERPPCRARWVAAQSILSDGDIDSYLRLTRLNEAEAALRCLHDAQMDFTKAALLLHQDRQRRLRATRQREAAINDEQFASAILAHGKRFSSIRQLYPEAATRDLVARFYLWKPTTAYKKWRERTKAKKNKEAARLRQWADTPESEAELPDFHNEYCELCVTGGQLLCCDGCERAYHFSCVEPPIKDVPMGDWFCARCAAILGTNAEERPSEENPFCREVVVLADKPRDALSEPDDDDGSHATDEIEDTTMDDDADRIKVEVVEIKQEPASSFPPRLYTPERPQLLQAKRPTALDGTPSKSPLLLESTNRKRQRKIVAPRRIPQSGGRPVAAPPPL